MSRANRKMVDSHTFTLSTGETFDVRLYEGEPDALLRIIAKRHVQVAGYWPAEPPAESNLEVSLGTP